LVDPTPLPVFKVRYLRQSTSQSLNRSAFSIRAGWRTLPGAIASVEISVYKVKKNKEKSLLGTFSRPVGNYI